MQARIDCRIKDKPDIRALGPPPRRFWRRRCPGGRCSCRRVKRRSKNFDAGEFARNALFSQPPSTLLIESPLKSRKRDGTGGEQKENKGPDVRPNFADAVSLEQNAADDSQKMSRRKHLPNPLRPDRHAFERKGKT